MAHIAHVDGKFLGVSRNLHMLLGEHKRTLFAVQGEHGYTVPHRHHQRGLRAVDAITSGHL